MVQQSTLKKAFHRHRLGRPRKQEFEKRKHPLRLFLNESEQARLIAAADNACTSKHDYVRSLIAGDEIKSVPVSTADPRELLALNSIGNLLNQIARRLNAGTPLFTSVEHAIEALEDHLTKVALRE